MSEIDIDQGKDLIEELCQDNYSHEILRFLIRHPYTRFEGKVLVNSLCFKDARRAEQTLEKLSGQQLLENTNCCGVHLYRLTRCESLRNAIIAALTPLLPKIGNVIERFAITQLTMPLVPCL